MIETIFQSIIQSLISNRKHLNRSRENFWLKQSKELVTEADIFIEDLIKKTIRFYEPDAVFIAEESEKDFSSGRVWIIDPIDGTHNFIRNYRHYNSSIAVFDGKFSDGLIVSLIDPCVYYSSLDGVSSVSKRSLDDAIINLPPNNWPLFLSSFFINKFFSVRVSGCATQDFIDISTGKIEARIMPSVKIWDVAAGIPIVEKAGGKITDFSGRKPSLFSENLLVSNGLIHDSLLCLISKSII